MAIIIGGHPRSGTNLLRTLCNNHPDISITGEFANFRGLGIPYGKFKKFILKRLDEKHLYHQTTKSKQSTKSDWKEPGFVEKYLAFLQRPDSQPIDSLAIENALKKLFPGSRLVGDKTPGYIFQLNQFAIDENIDCLIICRDCRDVVASVLEKVRNSWKDRVFVSRMDTAEKLAKRWVKTIRLIEKHKQRIHCVRYEDLVHEPTNTIGSLSKFLDVDPSGFPTALIHQSSVGNYRKRLSENDLDTVIDIAGPTMARFGYLKSDSKTSVFVYNKTETRDNSKFTQLTQPPVFVVGSARSGTTWVYDILTAPKEVAGIYESWLLSNNWGLGTLFGDAHREGRYSGLSNVLNREQLTEYVRQFAMQIMSHAIEPHHRVLVEKSPSHVYTIPLIRNLFPKSRFIHVLRDGRDVSVSVRAATRSWAPQWKHGHGRSVAASAKAWKSAVQIAQREGEKLGDDYLEIRYETLKKNPLETYRRMYDFCGISYDDKLLSEVHEKTDFQRNYDGKESAFRRGGRVGDWRHRFNLLDAYRFHRQAGKFLTELGYAKRFWWLSSPVAKFFSKLMVK